ncbi:MAG TPA: hypothetical protein PL182_12065, partial [Pseudobdellovibrionaceae bacterium]|nr:hypothetical protein [Pseudobdellovibrionaceae bacterium]
MKKVPIFLAILALLLGVSGFANASPGISYHGRLLKPNGQPVTSNSVQFRVQIRTPLPENCLLYQEFYSKDLSSSAGTFTVTINDGSATVLNTEPYTFDRVF